jgi:uncharacterized protein (DUF362 family)
MVRLAGTRRTGWNQNTEAMIEDNGTQNLANRLVVAEAELEKAQEVVKEQKAMLEVAATYMAIGSDLFAHDTDKVIEYLRKTSKRDGI